MTQYEFTEEENRHIDSLRRKVQQVSVLFLMLGVLQLVQSFLLTGETERWISLGAALLILGLGWLFTRPLDNLRRITTTTGQDIREVVIALEDLRAAYLGAEFIMLAFAAGIIIEVMRVTSAAA
jgi:hypothetical protein